jgi:outer membrane protein
MTPFYADIVRRAVRLFLGGCVVLCCAAGVAEEPAADMPDDGLLVEAEELLASDPVPGAGADGAQDGPLSPGAQTDPARSSLPEKDEQTQLRLRLDTIELERLYEALRESAQRPVIRISLEQCVQMALEQNTDILVTRYTPLKAETDIFSARGEFDPALTSQVSYTRATQSASSDILTYGGLPSTEVYRTTSSTSLQGKLHWGTTYTVTMDLSKEETTYNRFVEEWNGSLTFSMTQPLLRGRGKPVNLAFVRSALNSRSIAEGQLRSQVMSVIADTIKAYWDLVGAVEAVAVSEQSLANAERLLEINEQRYSIGTVAALDVAQAKAGVATRQSDLISARSRVQDAMDNLKGLLNMRDEDRLLADTLAPTDRPTLREIEMSEEASASRAVANRPEVATAELTLANARLDLGRRENEMLPQVDLTGSVSQGGRGHFPSDVFDGVRERDDNAYTVGVRGSLPLRNRAARGATQRAMLEVREAELRLAKARQDAILNTRLALRQVATSRILVESNRQARALQETNLQAEENRLRLGLTTSFQALRTQEDLANAQIQELQSVITYEKALVDLELAEGVLLDSLGIVFEPTEPEKPVGYFESVLPSLSDFFPES